MKVLIINNTVTYESVNNYKQGYLWIFSVKSLGYTLNNIHFIALHVFDVHNAFFCYFQSRLFSKLWCYSEAFDWFSCLNMHTWPAINTAWFKHLKMVKSWKHSPEILNSKQINVALLWWSIWSSYIIYCILNKVISNLQPITFPK